MRSVSRLLGSNVAVKVDAAPKKSGSLKLGRPDIFMSTGDYLTYLDILHQNLKLCDPDAATLTMSPETPTDPANIERDATLVYNYHRMDMALEPADAIFVLCSLDTRVAERGAQLLLDGYGRHLIFSGGAGKLTADRFAKPEAEVFADIALQKGVPADKIIIENKSTNTGENVRFTYSLLEEKGLRPRSLILVQKPYMLRRSFATFKKQWPDPQTTFTVTSPQLEFASYPNADNPRDLVIHIMVGDLVRIRDYPARGFQIPQDIPDEVWEAGQRLIAAGYDGHLP